MSTSNRSFIPGTESNLRWFVDPIGLARLANQVKFGDKPEIVERNRSIELLEKAGFDVFSGMGGNLCFATEDHELVHREFVCTSIQGDAIRQAGQRRALGLFNFDNKNITPIHAPDWIPSDASGCVVINWDAGNAIDNVGHFYDAFLAQGDFNRLLSDFKHDADLRLDLKKYFGSFDPRVVAVTFSSTDTKSDRIPTVMAYQIKGDGKFVMESVAMASGRRVIKHSLNRHEVLELKDQLVQDHEIFPLPGQEEEELEDMKPAFYVLAHGYLFVANDIADLKKVLEVGKNDKLVNAEDYQQIYTSLEKLTNPQNISFRHFGRLNSSVAPFYQSFRRGNFQFNGNPIHAVAGWANVILLDFSIELPSVSELVGSVALSLLYRDDDERIDEQKNAEKKKEELRIDGFKLPAEFQAAVASFLGPTGWVLETEQDGWRITGCILQNR